jgi:hypothetical protein
VTGTDRVQLHPHPAVYSVLMLPFGAVGGYLTVALAFTLSHSGASATEVGLLIATYGIPQAFKFLWAPIVDTSLGRKSWYVIGTTLSALYLVAAAPRPIRKHVSRTGLINDQTTCNVWFRSRIFGPRSAIDTMNVLARALTSVDSLVRRRRARERTS